MISRLGQLKWIAAFGLFVITLGCELEEGDGGDAGFADAGADAGGGGGGGTSCASDGVCNDARCDGSTTALTDPDCPRCVANEVCEPECGGTDPDCSCDCDRQGARCDAAQANSGAPCTCDPSCGTACGSDGSCDTFCPAGADPDCEDDTCDCDYYGGICEADVPDSAEICDCDDDCGAGDRACSDDGHCDTFCPDGFDPNCDETPECDCDYNEGICEAAERGSSDSCTCDEDCAGTDACKSDGHCDTWCPDGFDPDCD